MTILWTSAAVLSVPVTYYTLFDPVHIKVQPWVWSVWKYLVWAVIIGFLLLVFIAVYNHHVRTIKKLSVKHKRGNRKLVARLITLKADRKDEIGRLKAEHKAEIEQKEKEHSISNLNLIEGHTRHAINLSNKYKAEIDSLKSELDEFKAHKLKFEIDAHRSNVTVTSYHNEQFSVKMHLHICFENSDVNPLTVKRVSVLLIKKNEDETEKEIPLTDKDLYEYVFDNVHALPKREAKWEYRNLPVEGRHQTFFHSIEGQISADGDCRAILNKDCFLRVTMEAMNQPPYSLDFDVKWENINQGWIDITPRN